MWDVMSKDSYSDGLGNSRVAFLGHELFLGSVKNGTVESLVLSWTGGGNNEQEAPSGCAPGRIGSIVLDKQASLAFKEHSHGCPLMFLNRQEIKVQVWFPKPDSHLRSTLQSPRAGGDAGLDSSCDRMNWIWVWRSPVLANKHSGHIVLSSLSQGKRTH